MTLPLRRIQTEFAPVDQLLGGGIVRGSTTVVAGSRGAGKTTLLLQMAAGVANNLGAAWLRGERPETEWSSLPEQTQADISATARASLERPPQTQGDIAVQSPSVLFVTSEETRPGIYNILERIGVDVPVRSRITVREMHDVDQIVTECRKLKPVMLFIDSLMAVCDERRSGDFGSPFQIEGVLSALSLFGKVSDVAVVTTFTSRRDAHIRELATYEARAHVEHLADAVLEMQRLATGARSRGTQVEVLSRVEMSVHKNRFDSTSGAAMLELTAGGFRLAEAEKL